MRYILIVLMLCTLGCTEESKIDDLVGFGFGSYVPAEHTKEAAEFIKELVKNANPQSDEEPEDNIARAEQTMLKLYGVRTIGAWRSYRFTPYHELSPAFKARCLFNMGIKDGSQYELTIPVAEPEVDSRRYLLARVIFAEACGEGKTGMIATACVIRNRVHSSRREFGGSTYKSVILKKWQFSCVNGEGSTLWNAFMFPSKLSTMNKRSYDISLTIADDILSETQIDVTGGAVFYMTHKAATKTKWLLAGLEDGRLSYLTSILGHRFYKYSN